MKTYSIYIEGYCTTGQFAKARFVGTVEADNFLDASEKACISAYGYLQTKEYFCIVDGKAYFWGCQLFDNLLDAQKSFG